VIDQELSIRRLYLFTALFGFTGFVLYMMRLGVRPALGFLLGAAGSLGNLWLFNWLSRSIAPGERQQKPWTASLFVGRYLGLGLAGYATVKLLDVNPVPVLLGLLASTAAVLASSIFDLVRSFTGNKS
jgi:ATP synthase I chain